ncbi:MAG: C4-dicarboxylate ABC transporter [Gammaproteobacteria bacterium]|nr:C4-dicarboxylate ABC transporter [Gammaproteobacteria bacterium]
MDSRLTVTAEAKAENWSVKFQAKRVSDELINKLLPAEWVSSDPSHARKGMMNLSGIISGRLKAVNQFGITTEVVGLTDLTKDGALASENLQFKTQLEGKKIFNNQWAWQSTSHMTGGALYVDPVYVEAGLQPITLKARGLWNSKTKQADIQAFTYQHPETGTLSGSALAYYRRGLRFDRADVTLQSDTLQKLAEIYVNPFYAESPFQSLALTGALQANFTFKQHSLTDAALELKKLNVNDAAKRLTVNDGNAAINWSADPLIVKQSELSWRQLNVKGLPIVAAKLKFTSQADRFHLAEAVKLPFLNGMMAVDRFSWRGGKQEEPDVTFAGSLDNVSLEQLTRRLHWTPLLGNISGQIPGVAYRDNSLKLDGGLTINIFDGIVKINNLSSSGLFSNMPKLAGDVELQHLDLEQLTSKFEFGRITGRLSGFINKLELENWRPVTFFAWLDTPEDDDSKHRISQKAVKNIASIGGGAASDFLSRSFLGFFETFCYDKIGVGCYLHNGVCQMLGLEAVGEGYYLIKGGGLPRIEVLGYNSQINWDVLVERLSRVASPDTVIVQ